MRGNEGESQSLPAFTELQHVLTRLFGVVNMKLFCMTPYGYSYSRHLLYPVPRNQGVESLLLRYPADGFSVPCAIGGMGFLPEPLVGRACLDCFAYRDAVHHHLILAQRVGYPLGFPGGLGLRGSIPPLVAVSQMESMQGCKPSAHGCRDSFPKEQSGWAAGLIHTVLYNFLSKIANTY